MADKRIYELDATNTAQSGDFFAIDSEGEGTRKITKSNLLGGIEAKVGTVALTTTAQDCSGAINELKDTTDDTTNMMSDAYDNTATYVVGDIVIYDGVLYKCNTDISTAEDFDSSKWDATNLGDEIESIHSEIHPLVDKIYPVGSIYISVTNKNPGTLFGGTWHAFGSGRTLIGMGSNGTTNYTTVKHTGGAETVNLQHSHTVESHTHGLSSGYALIGRCADYLNTISYRNASSGSGTFTRVLGGGMGISSISKASSDVTALGGSTGGATPDTNNKLSTKQSIMQPYITVYMWERTA